MSTWPLVRFVDAPDPAAAIRYDFNDADAAASRRVGDDFTLGAPTLESDPDSVGVQWGLRAPAFTQRVKGSKLTALLALSGLSREMLRSTNWLMFQLDGVTAPVWLKTYRSGFQPLSLQRVYVSNYDGDPVELPDTWEIPVQMLADAFGYAERETLAQVTLGNAAAATNRLRYVLPAVKGDAPTNLRLTVTPVGSGASTGKAASFLVGVIAGTQTVTDPVIDIGTSDGWTADNSTPAGTTDSAYLGGSHREVTVAGTGYPANFLKRLHRTLASAPPAGRYKAMLRCEADPIDSITAHRYVMAIGQTVNAVDQWQPTVILDTPAPVSGLGVGAYAFQGWADLGEITLPFAADIPHNSGLTPPAPTLALKIGTADGTAGVVRIDALKLIPIDGHDIVSATLMKANFESAITNFVNGIYTLDYTLACTWDGDSERTWETSAGSSNLVDGVPMQRGSYPVADPAAVENVVIAFPTSRGRNNSGTAATAEAKTWTLDISYHPRLLHLPGDN